MNEAVKKIVKPMETAEWFMLVPATLDKTVTGWDVFNAKAARVQANHEKAIAAYDEAKKKSPDAALAAMLAAESRFKADCIALERERNGIMGECKTTYMKTVMGFQTLFVKSSGQRSVRHNAAVMAFGSYVVRMMRQSLQVFERAVVSSVKAGDHATCADFKQTHLAHAFCERVAAGLMPKYKTLAAAKKELEKNITPRKAIKI